MTVMFTNCRILHTPLTRTLKYNMDETAIHGFQRICISNRLCEYVCRMDYYEPRSVYGDYDRTHSKLLQFAKLHLIVMVKSVCL